MKLVVAGIPYSWRGEDMRPKVLGAPDMKGSFCDFGLQDSPKEGKDSILDDFDESEKPEHAVDGRVRSSWLLDSRASSES